MVNGKALLLVISEKKKGIVSEELEVYLRTLGGIPGKDLSTKKEI